MVKTKANLCNFYDDRKLDFWTFFFLSKIFLLLFTDLKLLMFLILNADNPCCRFSLTFDDAPYFGGFSDAPGAKIIQYTINVINGTFLILT